MDRIERLIEAVPTKKVYSLYEEFKAFAFKGNVIDLAVGVVIGTAFGKIVDSFVKSLVMPLLGVILPGRAGYLGWYWTIRGQKIPYGQFLGDVVNFLIVALALFLFAVKFLGWVSRTKAANPPLTKDQELLIEIRDAIRERGPKPV